MRIYKFRGRTKDGSWVYGEVVHNYSFTVNGNTVPCAILSDNDYIEVIDETVGQFTGLLDKNSKEIYEGDIFEGPYDDRPYSSFKHTILRRGAVEFHPLHGYCPFPLTGDSRHRFFPEWKNCEVIGNIYSTPELLEAKP